jgi:hypothetical protein
MALVGHISGSSQSNSVIGVSGSVIVANRPNSLFPSMPGSDVTFFVSGALDNTATAVFGGKVVLSGGLTVASINATTVSGSGNFDIGGDLRVAGDIRIDGNDIRSSTGDAALQLIGSSVIIPGDLTVNGTTVTVNTTNLEIKDSLIGLGFASGSTAQTNGDRGFIGGLATGNDVAMFWDDSAGEFAVVNTSTTPGSSTISIASYANFHAQVISGSALTGSLTKLSDGTDYLRAGSNISLTTGSAGQITIAATGLSGYVVGPASATDSAIALYDGTTGKLIKNSSLKLGLVTATQNYVTASVGLADYGLVLAPNGTGALSANAPNGTYTGGNARGDNAVDWQMSRSVSHEVASGLYSIIGGGSDNVASGNYSICAGGLGNEATEVYATVGGGNGNRASGSYSVVGGGQTNYALEDASTVSGGRQNNASAPLSTICGGVYGYATATGSFVGGGDSNAAVGDYSSVIGGLSNTAQSYGEVVGGLYATLGAGTGNGYVATDRLFVIGNGTGEYTRSNALTLIKNGNLHLSGTLTLMSGSTSGITFPSTRGTNGQVLTSNGSGLITWATPSISPQYFYSTTNSALYTTGAMAFIGGQAGIDAPSDKGSDVFFYVSGSSSSIALFGGTLATSGSLRVDGNTTLGDASSDTITFNARASSNLLPSSDNTYNLGSSTNRWANIYTGDLHLRNDRGDWTVIEEEAYLSIRNNKTGKLYKFVMEPVEE